MSRDDPESCFEAARRHYTLKLTCWHCQGVSIVHPAAIWWHFHRRGIPDTFVEVKRYAKCRSCLTERKVKIGGPKVELCQDEVTASYLPLPSEAAWKRELERKRR